MYCTGKSKEWSKGSDSDIQTHHLVNASYRYIIGATFLKESIFKSIKEMILQTWFVFPIFSIELEFSEKLVVDAFFEKYQAKCSCSTASTTAVKSAHFFLQNFQRLALKILEGDNAFQT
jgi:hypothetical protein